jgi:ABC-type multidrug transport system permease subunit
VTRAVVMLGLIMRPHGRVPRMVNWIGAGLLTTYVINAAMVYIHSG